MVGIGPDGVGRTWFVPWPSAWTFSPGSWAAVPLGPRHLSPSTNHPVSQRLKRVTTYSRPPFANLAIC